MKKPKTYRLSPVAVAMLDELKNARSWNETEIIEKAIDLLNYAELCIEPGERGKYRRMDGTVLTIANEPLNPVSL